jgi:F0F1-type ATP synthase assembly protein I
MTQYEAKIIQEFADRLYSKAKSVIASYTFWGIVLGAFLGFAFGTYSRTGPLFTIVGMFIVGAIGYSIGKEKAFQYKLQAQIALCQVKIEENSRLRQNIV